MITEFKHNPKEWSKDIYIASRIGVQLDDEGNEKVVYGEPIKYSFTVNTTNSSAEIAEFGEKAGITKRLVVPIRYKGEFKEFDVAYIDTTPEGEEEYGDNADYRLLPPREGNAVIIIYIQKILGK